MLYLLCLLALLLPRLASAATINAASCSISAIQSAVDAAAVGDTVHLPTCNQTGWTSTVTITKRIILEGNGTANTILNRDVDTAASFFGNPMFHVNGVQGFEMRQMTLDGTQDEDLARWQESALRLENCRDFRIHHMTFRDFAIGINVHGDPLVQRGLIDHNTFTDNYCTPSCGGSGSLGYGISMVGNGTYPAMDLGTAQNVFIEDNTFNGTTGNRHNVAGNNGARYVFRYNTITNSGPNAAMVDAHGYVKSWTTGTRQYEIYHNNLTDTTPSSHFAGIGPRGGDGVIWNNVITNMSSNRDIYLMNDYVLDGENNENCPVGRPTPYQIRDLYIWGNTRPDLTTPSSVVVDPDCTNNILLNTDYRLSARPGYTPYTYPHPGQGGTSPVPDFTTGLRMHLKFDENTLTTAQDSTVNNHDGTLENGATWGAAHMGTSALQLDGTNDQVTVTGLLTSPAAVTLAAWVLPSTYGTGGADVISIGNVVTLRLTTTQLTAHYWNGTAFTTLTGTWPTGNTWKHIAYTATAGAQQLYVNGGLLATGNAGAALSYAGQGTNTLIGNHGNAGTTTRYGGLIDDVRVYTRVLTANDIDGLANLEDPPPLSILITTPTNGDSYSTTNALLANLGGVASDETGVTGITWNCPTCTTTSGAATCTPACGASATDVNWNIPSITFAAAGNHVITVTAADASSTRTDTLTVTYTPPTGGAACTHYASSPSPPAGVVAGSSGNNGLSQGAPFLIANFWDVATPGKVLCLLNGTYTGGSSVLNVPDTVVGTASQKITIKALNDGAVLIAGGNGTRPVNLAGSHVIIEGMNVSGGDNKTLAMRGSNNIARRIIAYEGGDNDQSMGDTLIDMAGQNNLIEDCAGFGKARKTLGCTAPPIPSSGNVLRRCWVRWEDNQVTTSNPTDTFELGYGQDSCTMENILATRTVAPGGRVTDPEALGGAFRTWDSAMIGSIFYVGQTDTFSPSNILQVADDAGSPPQHGDFHTMRNFLVKHIVTFIHPSNSKFGSTRGINFFQNYNAPTNSGISDSLSVSGVAPSVTGGFTSSNVRHGTSLSAALSGSGHSTIWTLIPGVCKRYVNRTLTTTGLWPWPMNQRILDAMAQSGKTPVDVTATMRALFAPMPTECETESIVETCTPPRIGTPPTCTCPAGTVEPNCDPEVPPVTCPPDCPVQDVFFIAPAGSSPPGNDANACTQAAPCLTIDRARSLMTPGDRLYLQPGTYSGTANRITTSTGAFPAGNDWSTPTRIAAYAAGVTLQQTTGNVITLNNSTTDRYLVFDGLTCDAATTSGNDTKCLVMSGGVHHIRWQNGTLRNCHFTCLDIVDANSIEILNTTIHGTSHAQGASVGGTSDSVLFDGVTLHTNAGHGLNASTSGLTNLTVKNSTSRNNTGTGFQLGASPLTALNLLAYVNALGVRLTSLAVDGRLYNATVADNSGAEVQIDAGALRSLVTNVIAVGGIANAGTDTALTTNMSTDPGFVSSGSGNYRLASADSPAADAGTDLSAVFTTAIDGVTRPVGEAWDIGAYERAGSGGGLPTPGALSATPSALHFLVP